MLPARAWSLEIDVGGVGDVVLWARLLLRAGGQREQSGAAPEPRPLPFVRRARSLIMVKALVWVVVIIFLIGLLVVTGVLKALF